MGILLAIVAIFGVLTIGLIGWLLTSILLIVTFKFKKLDRYHKSIAIVLDKLGNVLLGSLMNETLIDKDSPQKFGDHKETISDNLGDNKKLKKFKPLGKNIADGLNKIDPNHVEKASGNNN